ncbi:MAG: transcription elongation factor GreA [Propionicimonas sp.]|uniref:transcription elongation factor GreA n=1 Tax=Propionicimonas sp. TaxID=1955623 RepID=UPI002B2133A1|nr:transcription elongation factor GreA [Propionicimonas sp.]MEA4943574.1 transcription elongation factor GreA [Propionicimonas sp.]MEA5054440.1 transcription elongation factor GreA [Propionicimonas sp.]MEA5116413.1 transcription elongation factor GreA [Propionicimonas sp.]
MAVEQNMTTWLTQDAYDKLVAELNHLKGEGRRLVSAKIAQARDEGDLSENGGYHAAREEQGQQEARIRQLAAMLENAEVGEAPSGSQVTPGTLVTVYFDDDEDDEDTFLLGSREVLGLDDAVDIEVYSPQSPLGAAILGAAPGDTVSYAAPSGSAIEVTIVSVTPYTG